MHAAREPLADGKGLAAPAGGLPPAGPGPARGAALELVPTQAAAGTESDVEPTAQSWLEAQCAMIAGVSRGVVVSSIDEGVVGTIALWQAESGDRCESLVEAARESAARRTVVVRAPGDGAPGIIASPLVLEASSVTIVALEVSESKRGQHQAIVQLLQWGATWYQLMRRESQRANPRDRLATVVELLADGLEHEGFDAAATAVVTDLAARIGCTRVSIGLSKGNHVDVAAVSHSAQVDARSNLVREIGAAMDEAIDQGATVACPPLPDSPPRVAFAQEVLARRDNNACVISTPLYSGTRPVGALTLEREHAFDRTTVQTCETLAALLGPIVELKHDHDRWIGAKIWQSLHLAMTRLAGRGHLSLKLYVLAVIAVVSFFAVATGEYRVTATASLEGSVKRVVTAPLDGFVESAAARAGDVVEAGQLLATLDDRELELEQLRWEGQREQLQKEQRAAMTTHDRSKAAILRAQMKQTRAQLALIEEQLARTRLTAPFAGVVVSGDLSQSLGSPVENGEVLFEVAPLDAYRVILEVDERSIGEIATGQRGELTLAGLPNAALPFTVARVVPLSTARDGSNVFEVEATLDTPSDSIRPGMAGVGKISIDRRRLVWIWTHALFDRLRLALWTWIA